MIITCPCGQKKFEVDENLIPDKGRLLKCGSCEETWFFNKNNQSNLDQLNEIKDDPLKPLIKEDKIIKKNLSNLAKNKGTEIVKYKSESTFTIGSAFNYIIVSIITFVAVIIILDTFKDPLSILFPNIELILYNLFETLRDLSLFAKDLI